MGICKVSSCPHSWRINTVTEEVSPLVKQSKEDVKLNNSSPGRLEVEEFKHRMAEKRTLQKQETVKTQE